MMLSVLGLVALMGSGCASEPAPASRGDDDGGGVGASRAELQSTGAAFAWVTGSTGAISRYRVATATGTPTSSRISTGSYSIAFNFNPKHVQVAMAGTSTGVCKLFSTTSTTIYVVCYATDGSTLQDRDFVVQAANYSGTNGTATAFYATVSNTAGISDSWSASGGSITGSLNSTTKVRTITASGISGSNSSVHVTTIAGDTSRCRIVNWGTATVNVECRTTAGALATPSFTLWYGDAGPFSEYNNIGGPLVGGHAWHNGTSGEHSSYNRKSITYCSTGTVTGSSSGNDRLFAIPSDLWQSSADEVTALVTPYGSGQIDYRVRRVGSNYVVSASNYAGTTVDANAQYFTFSMGTVDYLSCY